MERFMVVLSSIKRMPAALKEDLQKGVYPVRLKKGEIIQTATDHVDGIYFVEKGLVQLFKIKDAQKYIHRFTIEDQFIIAVKAVLSLKTRSEGFSIEALEDCILWHFSSTLLQEIFEKHSLFRLHYTQILGVDLGLMELAGMCGRFENDNGNYYLLRENFPYLLDRVPTPNLANFISLKESVFRHLHSKKNPTRL
jgi:CRP-like cAMP-binding protein